MSSVWVNKFLEVCGDDIEVDYTLHCTLNMLARRLYVLHGYQVDEGFDFSISSHPTERLMYDLALESYYFHLTIGLE